MITCEKKRFLALGHSLGCLLEGINLEMRVPIFQINEVISELYNCRMADMPANKHIRTCNVFWGFYVHVVCCLFLGFLSLVACYYYSSYTPVN